MSRQLYAGKELFWLLLKEAEKGKRKISLERQSCIAKIRVNMFETVEDNREIMDDVIACLGSPTANSIGYSMIGYTVIGSFYLGSAEYDVLEVVQNKNVADLEKGF